MNIECLVNKLLPIVDRSVRATGKNLSLPVLSCLLIKADKASGNLNIKSTNLDIGVDFNIQVKCTESGMVAVPGQIFLNLLSSLNQNDTVKILNKDGNLSISSKNNHSLIKCVSPDDFPTIPEVTGGKKGSIKTNDFVNGIRSVSYSASISSIKPELSSVYINQGNQELLFVSTDSFRLAEKRVFYKNPLDMEPILIPYKSISDILKIIDGISDEITLKFDKNQLEISFGQSKLVTRLVDASFPDYKQIIPKQTITQASVLKGDLVKTIKSAQVFSDNLNQVRLKFSGKDSKIHISAKNQDVGEYSESIQSKIDGDDLEISFNYKYILDPMQSLLDSESINLSLAGPGKPMIISGASDKSFSYIVMPMNK